MLRVESAGGLVVCFFRLGEKFQPRNHHHLLNSHHYLHQHCHPDIHHRNRVHLLSNLPCRHPGHAVKCTLRHQQQVVAELQLPLLRVSIFPFHVPP